MKFIRKIMWTRIRVAPEPFEVLKPIPVVIQQHDDEFLAGCFDAHIHASGDNEQEAFDNLRSLVLDFFESLEEEDPARLGPVPVRQLAILRTFLRRKA